MKKPKNVESYIKTAPKEVQGKLKELRRIIKKTVPQAQEKLSYGMPYYSYKGRLAYFAFAQKHIGLYIPAPVLQEYAQELKQYSTAKATVRFPLDKKLPTKLIEQLIKARMKKNDEKRMSPFG